MAAVFMVLRKRTLNIRLRRRRDTADEGESENVGVEKAAAAAAAVAASATAPTFSSTATPQSLHSGPPKIYWRYQLETYQFYTSNPVQLTVALVIIGNFVITILEKEYDPYPEGLQQWGWWWQTLDSAFNILFAVELVINMAGSWFCFFWKNPWNVFDFVVVLVGLLAMGNALDGPLEDLKMLRAFRVFRLFKRVKSLNKIVTALLKAVPGVVNAFLIMLIVMCIYAILAVEYFRSAGEDGTFLTETMLDSNGDSLGRDASGTSFIANQTVTSITARGLRYGGEYYGTFSRALYTLFQVLTGESWAEAVARPLLFGAAARNALGAAFFFTSFILLTQIVLINVVVAVLLDKFVTEEPAENDAVGRDGSRASTPLTTHMTAVRAELLKSKMRLRDVIVLKGRIEELLDAMGESAETKGALPLDTPLYQA